MCAYYPHRAHEQVPRTQAQWAAYHFCHAVKSGEINGYADLPLKDGRTFRLEQRTVGVARNAFGQVVLRIHADNGLAADLFVAVPSKDSFDTEPYRSLGMVREALEGKTEIPVAAAVRFTERIARASEGGPRDRMFLRERMEIIRRPSRMGERVVLVDDLVTRGGTLLATKDVLEGAGYEVVAAIVCGRTLHTHEPSFAIRSFELSDNDLGGFSIRSFLDF